MLCTCVSSHYLLVQGGTTPILPAHGKVSPLTEMCTHLITLKSRGQALKSRLLTARSRRQSRFHGDTEINVGRRLWRVVPPPWCTTTGQLSADFGSRQRSGSLNFAARGGVAHQRGCVRKEKKVQLLRRPKIGCWIGGELMPKRMSLYTVYALCTSEHMQANPWLPASVFLVRHEDQFERRRT